MEEKIQRLAQRASHWTIIKIDINTQAELDRNMP